MVLESGLAWVRGWELGLVRVWGLALGLGLVREWGLVWGRV